MFMICFLYSQLVCELLVIVTRVFTIAKKEVIFFYISL